MLMLTKVVHISTSIICFLVVTARCANLQDWAEFNTSIGGRLQKLEPLALPCFSLYNGTPNKEDEAVCLEIRQNYTAVPFLAGSVGVTLDAVDNVCLSDPQDQCLLDNTITPAPLPSSNSSCNQGNLGLYYVAVQDASDASAAFAFARQHQIPLSIKNSGHDYMTRNTQKGSLLLWVHELQNMSYAETFTPEGCCPPSTGGADKKNDTTTCTTTTRSYGPVVTIGTGVSSDAATNFATRNNATLLVGASPTIAVSGGWVLGAGHSVLSPVYGLGVDRVVQFRLVTPDGVERTANACQEPELFWALRGGGGGTFGLVLEATHRVEPAPLPIAVANLTLPANLTTEVATDWLLLQARLGLAWGRQGWGGHGAGRYLTMMNPLPEFANTSDASHSAASESMRAATEFITAHGGTSLVEVLPSWSAVWDKYITPQAASAVGSMRVLANRLWPQRLFETEAGQASILAFMTNLSTQFGVDLRSAYIPIDTPFLVPGSNATYDTNTSTHPAWYFSLWNFGGAVANMAWNSSYENRLQAITNATIINNMLRDLVGPDGGSYVHETDPFTQDWQNSFWGSNYERLLEVKKKYDPDMLLNCWKCVGFEESDIQGTGFECQGKLQLDMDAIIQEL